MKLEGMIIKVDGKLYRLVFSSGVGCPACDLRTKTCSGSCNQSNPIDCNRLRNKLSGYIHFKRLIDV